MYVRPCVHQGHGLPNFRVEQSRKPAGAPFGRLSGISVDRLDEQNANEVINDRVGTGLARLQFLSDVPKDAIRICRGLSPVTFDCHKGREGSEQRTSRLVLKKKADALNGCQAPAPAVDQRFSSFKMPRPEQVVKGIQPAVLVITKSVRMPLENNDQVAWEKHGARFLAFYFDSTFACLE